MEEFTTEMKTDNAFETFRGAKEWIRCIENEKGTAREKEIDPFIASWAKKHNFKKVLDLGCGQGMYSTKIPAYKTYVGIDSSLPLIEHAEKKYKKENRIFVTGNAYSIPFAPSSFDACLSITLWFHLKDLFLASEELSKTLKKGGRFLIVTPNPNAYDIWKTFYKDITFRKDGSIIGTSKVLLNPGEKKHRYTKLSENTFYFHSMEYIKDSMKAAGLKISSTHELGVLPISNGKNIFIAIEGYKK